MDLVLAYVPARFKKARILPNSTESLLSSGKSLNPLTVHKTKCHFSEEEWRQGNSHYFEEDISNGYLEKCYLRKKVVKNYITESVGGEKRNFRLYKHKETACYMTSTKVKEAKQLSWHRSCGKSPGNKRSKQTTSQK